MRPQQIRPSMPGEATSVTASGEEFSLDAALYGDDREMSRVRRPKRDSSSDIELVSAVKAGDDAAFEAIAHRYLWLVRARARSFFLQGAEYEDLAQEGMIGLFKAVRDFRQNGSTFRTFAELCITRQIITAVKSASRHKHAPLNAAMSLEKPRFGGDGGITLGDTLGDRAPSFDAAFLETEELQAILAILRQRLSLFEYRALILWLHGRSFEEIAKLLGKRIKSVDNGIWRVKCKIRRLLDEGVIARG